MNGFLYNEYDNLIIETFDGGEFYYVKGTGLSDYVGTDMSITGEVSEDKDGNLWLTAKSFSVFEHQGEPQLPEADPDSTSKD